MKSESARITVAIPAQMYRQLKQQAAAQSRPIRELILAGIEKVLLRGRRPKDTRVHFPLIHSKGPKLIFYSMMVEVVRFQWVAVLKTA
jgi:hypothetical protein